LIGSCTDLNVNSSPGSCSGSNLNYWLRLVLRPKCKLRRGSTPALRLRDHLRSIGHRRVHWYYVRSAVVSVCQICVSM